jgi:hypothetical protein
MVTRSSSHRGGPACKGHGPARAKVFPEIGQRRPAHAGAPLLVTSFLRPAQQLHPRADFPFSGLSCSKPELISDIHGLSFVGKRPSRIGRKS